MSLANPWEGVKYVRVHDPGHDLAMANGDVYLHRKVLFDAIGRGPHPCYGCSRPVEFRSRKLIARIVTVLDDVGRRRADLDATAACVTATVDHLDGDGENNDLANLVPSCRPCNMARALRGNPRPPTDEELFALLDWTPAAEPQVVPTVGGPPWWPTPLVVLADVGRIRGASDRLLARTIPHARAPPAVAA